MVVVVLVVVKEGFLNGEVELEGAESTENEASLSLFQAFQDREWLSSTALSLNQNIILRLVWSE